MFHMVSYPPVCTLNRQYLLDLNMYAVFRWIQYSSPVRNRQSFIFYNKQIQNTNHLALV